MIRIISQTSRVSHCNFAVLLTDFDEILSVSVLFFELPKSLKISDSQTKVSMFCPVLKERTKKTRSNGLLFKAEKKKNTNIDFDPPAPQGSTARIRSAEGF